MRINYDFNDLEAFLAVKETHSFHLAAERLNLSQSAVTRRVQKLEQALDAVLFERTTREVRPTLAAKRLQARAEAILEDARETTLAMRDETIAFAHQRNAVVSVAIIPTLVPLIIPEAIRRFRDTGNAARFRLLDYATNKVAEAVASGEADFGISSIPELEPNTDFAPLFDDEIVLVHGLDHRLAARDVVSWAEIVDEVLIVPARGTGNRLLIDEAMARERLPLAWSFEVRRSSTAVELVANGIGAALLPRSTVAGAGLRGLGIIRVIEPNILRPVGMLTRIGHKPTASEAVFRDIVRTVAADLAMTGGIQRDARA